MIETGLNGNGASSAGARGRAHPSGTQPDGAAQEDGKRGIGAG
jgi:hypothetical protein